MKKLYWIGFCLAVGVGTAQAALDETDKRFIQRMIEGGPETTREVAESLFNSGEKDTQILDVAAEVMLQRYPRASLDRSSADSIAWLCKALGGSGNGRYKAAVDEVADKAENRKLRGHCDKAAKALPKGATDSYTAGMVKLDEELKKVSGPATAKAAPAKTTTAQTNGAARTVDFSLVREGMSAAEVESILGPPTATSQHMTGKQFRPFNFGARDLQRMYYLYKGVGRIEFSLKSAYEGVFRVITIMPDPNESGYP